MIPSATLRRIHALPRTRLVPLVLWGPEARRAQREYRDMLSPQSRLCFDAYASLCAEARDMERVARAQSARLRLTAAFWAGWAQYLPFPPRWKDALDTRPLFRGPTWLGSNRPGKPAVYARVKR